MVDKKDYEYKVSAAGRVNIIGEHVDYCGGKVMPAALSFRNTVYIRPNGTNTINLSWTTLPDKVSLNIDKLDTYKNLKYGNYQAGAAYVWQQAGHTILGCDMLQDCTVPFGSGLSSSAAIEVSTIAALAVLAGEKSDSVAIALAAQKAEREYVGMNCGIMDQYAAACGKKNHAMLLDCTTLDCTTLECEYLPMELGEYSLMIIDSNKPHNLVESKYNERRAETEEALRILQKEIKIRNLAELSPSQFERYSKNLPQQLYKRALHIVEECERVRQAKHAMQSGDIAALGKLLNQSHASLRELYEVTGRELDALAHAAQSHPACIGSRMTGGGFGGCTVSLVKTAQTEDFKEYVVKRYNEETGYTAKCYETDIDDGIIVTKL